MDERASPLRVLHRQLLYRRARFAMQIQAWEKALCKIHCPELTGSSCPGRELVFGEGDLQAPSDNARA